MHSYFPEASMVVSFCIALSGVALIARNQDMFLGFHCSPEVLWIAKVGFVLYLALAAFYLGITLRLKKYHNDHLKEKQHYEKWTDVYNLMANDPTIKRIQGKRICKTVVVSDLLAEEENQKLKEMPLRRPFFRLFCGAAAATLPESTEIAVKPDELYPASLSSSSSSTSSSTTSSLDSSSTSSERSTTSRTSSRSTSPRNSVSSKESTSPTINKEAGNRNSSFEVPESAIGHSVPNIKEASDSGKEEPQVNSLKPISPPSSHSGRSKSPAGTSTQLSSDESIASLQSSVTGEKTHGDNLSDTSSSSFQSGKEDASMDEKKSETIPPSIRRKIYATLNSISTEATAGSSSSAAKPSSQIEPKAQASESPFHFDPRRLGQDIEANNKEGLKLDFSQIKQEVHGDPQVNEANPLQDLDQVNKAISNLEDRKIQEVAEIENVQPTKLTLGKSTDDEKAVVLTPPLSDHTKAVNEVLSSSSGSDVTILDPRQPDQIIRANTSLTFDALQDGELEDMVTDRREALKQLIKRALHEAKKEGNDSQRPIYIHLQHQIHVEIVNKEEPNDAKGKNDNEPEARKMHELEERDVSRESSDSSERNKNPSLKKRQPSQVFYDSDSDHDMRLCCCIV